MILDQKAVDLLNNKLTGQDFTDGMIHLVKNYPEDFYLKYSKDSKKSQLGFRNFVWKEL